MKLKNYSRYVYLLNRRVCIARDIKALETTSGNEKEIEELEQQDRMCLEESLELTKDWPASSQTSPQVVK